MRPDRPSQTALLLAAAIVLQERDTAMSPFISKATADLGDKILRSYSSTTRWLRRLLHQPWFSALAKGITRLTIPGILLHYVLRKKCLAELAGRALAEGVEQVVILGSGFDAVAVDLSRNYPRARLWEIDHPATQRWKARMPEVCAESRIRLLPADLSSGTLPIEMLAATGFDSAATSFWIAEGLLMYLPEATVRALLAEITSLTTGGSTLAFTFMEKRSDGRIRFRRQTRLVDWWLAKRDEPFLSANSDEELRHFLEAWKELTFLRESDLRRLGRLDATSPLAAGEIIGCATR